MNRAVGHYLQSQGLYVIPNIRWGDERSFTTVELLTGPNGKTKNVIAVYQIDKGSSTPRLVTNYVEGK